MSELRKWTEVVRDNTTSADRCGMDDVVRVALVRELAARLEECQRDRQRLIADIEECCKQTKAMADRINNERGLPGSEERYFGALEAKP